MFYSNFLHKKIKNYKKNGQSPSTKPWFSFNTTKQKDFVPVLTQNVNVVLSNYQPMPSCGCGTRVCARRRALDGRASNHFGLYYIVHYSTTCTCSLSLTARPCYVRFLWGRATRWRWRRWRRVAFSASPRKFFLPMVLCFLIRLFSPRELFSRLVAFFQALVSRT